MKILIVEDHPSMRELLKVLLEGEGYDILEAADGSIGVQMARSEKPDLMILDLMLPEIEGEKVLTEVQDDGDLSEMPVLVVSAKYDALERCKDLVGRDNVFSKPFEPTKLLDRVGDLLGHPEE